VIRNTRQRDAIRHALDDTRSQGFIGAQQLYSNLRATGMKISLSTVYRGLHELAVAGEADTVQNEGESLFRVCAPGARHHHLVCRSCGKTVEVEGDEVERWVERVTRENGYAQASHVVDLFGYCPTCTNSALVGRSCDDIGGSRHAN